MFNSLTDRLGKIFDKLTGAGRLSESDVDAALREIRLELLEADVALNIVKPFIEKIRTKAVGRDILDSVTPGQQVVKIVHDHLVALLNGRFDSDGDDENADAEKSPAIKENVTPLNFLGAPPHVILMVGLQGSGKTTSSAKLAKFLKEKEKKKVMMASLDVARPAAQEQLKILGEEVDVKTLPIIAGQMGIDICIRAMDAAKLGGYDVLILDSAGRLQIDDQLMAELLQISKHAKADDTLLVADALAGQDAVNVAEEFHKKVGLSGIILTRMDADARAGAAISMRHVTGCDIKFLGHGEKMDALEIFHAERVARRILGMGDIVSLVEKAQENLDNDEAEKLAKNMEKGEFSMDDMAAQLRQLKKMGGMGGIMDMLPGMGKMKNQLKDAKFDEKIFTRQEAIISSMTAKERKNPKIIHASRKSRIAKGSGTSVQAVNKLLKQHQTMGKMVKKVKKMGKAGLMRNMSSLLGNAGGGKFPF